jgi:ActR/RegA family two-component response regulator
MPSILLIDDDEYENIIVTRILANHFKYGFLLDFAKTLDDALTHLMTNTYDYVFLDDRLSATINSVVSVKVLKQYLKGAELVIISNNLYEAHLLDKSILQVADIVHKDDLPNYVYTSV